MLRGVAEKDHGLRRQLQRAAIEHSRVHTHYGYVIQQLDLGHDDLRFWEYCNPFAWLYYISTLNNEFGQVMRDYLRPGRPMTIAIYADEVCRQSFAA